MQILDDSIIKIEPITSGDGATARSVIVLNGNTTNTLVKGIVLEATVKWNKMFVLFLTDDTPYEEILHVYLLDNAGSVIDLFDLGGIYSTGSFDSLELKGENKIKFRFIGNTDWHIEILPRPVMHLPVISDPKGVSRGLRFKKYMVVTGNPEPQI